MTDEEKKGYFSQMSEAEKAQFQFMVRHLIKFLIAIVVAVVVVYIVTSA